MANIMYATNENEEIMVPIKSIGPMFGGGNREGHDCWTKPTVAIPYDASTITAAVETKPSSSTTSISGVGIDDDDDEVQVIKYVDKVKMVPAMDPNVGGQGDMKLLFTADTDAVLKAIQHVDRCLELNIQERVNLINYRNSLYAKLKLHREVGGVNYTTAEPNHSESSTIAEENTEKTADLVVGHMHNTGTNLIFIPKKQTYWPNNKSPWSLPLHGTVQPCKLSSNKTGIKREKEEWTMKSKTPPPSIVLSYLPQMTPPPPASSATPNPTTPPLAATIVPNRAFANNPIDKHAPHPASESEKKILGILKRHSESIQNMSPPTTSYQSQNFNSPLQFVTKPKPPTPPSSTRMTPKKIRKQARAQDEAQTPSWDITLDCDLGNEAKRSRNEQSENYDYSLTQQDRQVAYINTFPDPESYFDNDAELAVSVTSFPAPEVEIISICERCRSNKADFVCAGCSNIWYCSKECQEGDWDVHASRCADDDESE